ncbi:MAG: helix-turn-helix domain-containing protein, partial [Myxococcota bacterium]
LRARMEQLAAAYPGDGVSPLKVPASAVAPWVEAEAGAVAEATNQTPRSATKGRTRRPPRERLEQLLGEHEGEVARVADALGVGRKTVYRWLEAYALSADAFRR